MINIIKKKIRKENSFSFLNLTFIDEEVKI